PVNGTVESLGGKVGEVMAVGSELIRLQVDGSGNMAAAAKPGRPAKPDASPPEAAERVQAQAVARPAEPAATESHVQAAKPGSASSASAMVGATAAPSAARPQGEKPLASPAVRKRAWDLGIELQYVSATGAG